MKDFKWLKDEGGNFLHDSVQDVIFSNIHKASHNKANQNRVKSSKTTSDAKLLMCKDPRTDIRAVTKQKSDISVRFIR